MSNITAYPLQDGFETTLAQSWAGGTGTVYLNTAPSFTFPVGVKTYIVVNPGKTNMQVGEIDSMNVGAKTVNVSSISVGSGAGTTYTQQSHSVGSTVIISDNYQFWKNIIDAVNTKIDGLVQGIYFYADATARDADLGASPSTSGLIAGLTTEGKITYSLAGSWMDWSTTSSTFVNASETAAGKVEEATQAEFDAGTKVGGTGADLYPTPDKIQNMINTATAKTSVVNADLIAIADSAASGINKKITFANFIKYINGFGDGSDGDVTITTTITMTRDMFYNNLTITSPGILIPDGYRIFVRGTLSGNGKIQRNGNAGANASGSTHGAGGAALNAGTLNADLGGGNGGDGGAAGPNPGAAGTAGTSANPSYTTTNGSGGGIGGASVGSAGAAGVGGTSTRGALYNVGYNPSRIFYALCGPASFVTPAQYKGSSSAGGGGGGGGNNAGPVAGAGGGGGGGNGGTIRAAINEINWTGTRESIGGAGGNGANGGTAGAGGGGGGGNGGTLFIIYKTLTSGIGTKTLTGGAKGNKGTGAGSPADGVVGSAGTSIEILVV